MGVGFGDFPPEIVAGIAEFLDASHPPSLLAFAQTSKAHYAISSRFLFRTVKITLGDTEELEKLHREVDKWEAILLRSDAFAHVRRLIFYSADMHVKVPDNPYLFLEPGERDDDPAHFQTCWDLYHGWWAPKFIEPESLEPESPFLPLHNEDWRPVVHLIRQLCGLTDIIYACTSQFPSCVLETLRLELPRCRLHHFNFRLRDRNDAYERTLAMAPCLYSIGNLNHVQDEAGWTLARHHAPHLTNVFAWASNQTSRNDTAGSHKPSENAGLASMGTLQHIELGKRGYLTEPQEQADFVTVARIAFNDFSALRILKVNSPIDYRTLPAPENFPSLVTLALAFIRDRPMDSSYWTAALAFVRNLSRLTTLQLEAWNRAVSFVPGLGPTLRQLQVSTQLHQDADPLSCEHIHQLAILCPELEELSIEMRRSRGDASEVALYRALGRLPRLRRLALELDASPAPRIQVTREDGTVVHDTPVEPWFDAWGAEYLLGGPTGNVYHPSLHPHRRGHLLDVFVNSAIDENLARSIFAVIDGAKSAITGGGVVALEQLEIAACSAGFPQHGTSAQPLSDPQQPWFDLQPVWFALQPYLKTALARRWLVTRSVRDDAHHVLHVRELCYDCSCRKCCIPQGWCGEFKLSKDRLLTRGIPELISKGGPFAEVWSRLWPDKGDGRLWLGSWESWPLDLGPGGQ